MSGSGSTHVICETSPRINERIREICEENGNTEMEYESKSTVSREAIPLSLAVADVVEGWVALRPERAGRKAQQKAWTQMLAILNQHTFTLLTERNEPHLIIDVMKLCDSRLVTAADVRFADAESLPKIFNVMYDARADSLSNNSRLNAMIMSNASSDTGSALWKHHDYQELSFHATTYCDDCNKKLSDPIKPPRALECKSCGYKMHKEHEGNDISICKAFRNPRNTVLSEMLIMAPDPTECRRWVRALLKAIEARNPKLASS